MLPCFQIPDLHALDNVDTIGNLEGAFMPSFQELPEVVALAGYYRILGFKISETKDPDN